MRKIWIFLVLPLFGFTRIHTDYIDPRNTQDEFSNLENTVQDQENIVFVSTPNLSDVKDKQIFLISSGTYNSFGWRYNQEIYAVSGSCVTIRR